MTDINAAISAAAAQGRAADADHQDDQRRPEPQNASDSRIPIGHKIDRNPRADGHHRAEQRVARDADDQFGDLWGRLRVFASNGRFR